MQNVVINIIVSQNPETAFCIAELFYYSFSVEKRRKKENKKTNKKKSEKVTGRIKKWKAKRIKETCSFM